MAGLLRSIVVLTASVVAAHYVIKAIDKELNKPKAA